MHLYACASVAFFLPAQTRLRWNSYRGDGFLVLVPKKRTGSIVAFFGKFPIHLNYVYTTAHALCFRFHMFIMEQKFLFLPAQTPSTLAQYLFHVYLVGNPKRESEFKMAVTVGLQDISSMNITLETSYDFILYVFYSRIKLNVFCQRRPQ